MSVRGVARGVGIAVVVLAWAWWVVLASILYGLARLDEDAGSTWWMLPEMLAPPTLVGVGLVMLLARRRSRWTVAYAQVAGGLVAAGATLLVLAAFVTLL